MRRGGSCWRSTVRRRRGPPTFACSTHLSLVNIDHHHDNTRFGTANLVVGEASSTAEVLADVFAELGVAADARDRRVALRGARDRHGTLSVLKYDAEGAQARRRSCSRRAPTSRRFFGASTSRWSSPKSKLLARALDRAALYEGGQVVVSYLVRDRLRRGRRGGAVLRRDHRRPASGRGGGARRADPRAPAGGRPGAGKSRWGPRPTESTSRRSREVRRRGPSAGGRVFERAHDPGDHGVYRVRVRRASRAAA